MLLHFTKMHGLGNDFMIVDCLTQSVRLLPAKIRQWADRRRGIGFDQLLAVMPPTCPDADFSYRIYNADGSEAGQCGNGARCFARFVYEKRLSAKKTIQVQVTDRIISLTLENDDQVTVNMGIPVFTPPDIPFQPDNINAEALSGCSYQLPLADNQTIHASVLSMGNPHAVIHFPDLHSEDKFWEAGEIESLGRQIQNHVFFPQGCNVGFFEVTSREAINLRVYERGAGETMACGTGACAAMVAASLQGLIDNHAQMHIRGGIITVRWNGPGHPVLMTGSATRVFEGQLRI